MAGHHSEFIHMRGNRSRLDNATQTSMESAFRSGFDQVRVHTNSHADLLNRRLTARAFTTGNDIFLRSDASSNDTRLMTHALTHVVQQRMMSNSGGMHVGGADNDHCTTCNAKPRTKSKLSELATRSGAAGVAAASRMRQCVPRGHNR